MEDRSFEDIGMEVEARAFLDGPWQDFYNAHMSLTALVRKNLFTQPVEEKLRDYYPSLPGRRGQIVSCRVFTKDLADKEPYKTRSHRGGFTQDQAAEIVYGQLGLQAEFGNGLEPYMRNLGSTRRPLDQRLQHLLMKWDDVSQIAKALRDEKGALGVSRVGGQTEILKKPDVERLVHDLGIRHETCSEAFPRMAREVDHWRRANSDIIPQKDQIALEVATERYREAFEGLKPFIEHAREYMSTRQEGFAGAALARDDSACQGR